MVGCGSIGRRHAGNARAHGTVAVTDQNDALASSAASDLRIQAFPNLDTALAWRPDAVIVATPHDTHVAVAVQAIAAGAHVLVEKPIAAETAGVVELIAQAEAAGRVLAVVNNMRFHPAIRALHAALPQIGKPLFARAHYGNYLPNMRPGSDYRALYCARSEAGGGVIRDAIHEIDYLCWLFGAPLSVSAEAGRLSDLDIDAEDWASITLHHVSGTRSVISLDYLQQCKSRGCEIVGTEGTLLWSSLSKTPEECSVRLFRKRNQAWEVLVQASITDVNEPYLLMLDAFFAGLRSERADLLDGRLALVELETALAALRAAKDGRRITGIAWGSS